MLATDACCGSGCAGVHLLPRAPGPGHLRGRHQRVRCPAPAFTWPPALPFRWPLSSSTLGRCVRPALRIQSDSLRGAGFGGHSETQDDISIPKDVKLPILNGFYCHIYNSDWIYLCTGSLLMRRSL